MVSRDKSKDEQDIYEATIDRFIQAIAKNMNLYGVTSSVGRLYGALYFSEDPMTLDDMREALEMSKTSMSTGVRTLAEMRMVQPTYKKGVRKDLYKADDDWYKSFQSLFGDRWKYQTAMNIEEADHAIEQLEQLIQSTTDELLRETMQIDLDKILYGKAYYKWLMKFIQVIESGEIFEFIPKEPISES